MSEDLYEVLGVARTATLQDIRKAFRRLLRLHHPDKNAGSAKSEAKAKELNRAHSILTDERLRAAYDEFGAAALRPGFDPAQARATKRKTKPSGPRSIRLSSLPMIARPTMQPPRSGFDVLSALMGRQRANDPGDDYATQIDLTFAEAIRGTQIVLEDSSGQTVATVVAPSGTSDGSVLRVDSLGASSLNGGPNGDPFVTFRVAPHPLFRRDGDTLHVEIPVTIHEASFGARLTIPTASGEVMVRLPPKTQTGTVLRIRGKGLPRSGDAKRAYGDLLARILVHATDVRVRVEEWREKGITAVPSVIINQKHLIQGGQPAEVFERALRELAKG
jgi:curved DNA-binding protein